MAQIEWSGAVDGSLEEAGNWVGGVVPDQMADTILIPTGLLPNWPNAGTTYCVVTNSGAILGGTYYGKVTNATGGRTDFSPVFEGEFENQSGAEINGGTFNAYVLNNGHITPLYTPTFASGMASVTNNDNISGGTFNGTVTNTTTGTIEGGNFNGTVTNLHYISGGGFFGTVTNDRNDTDNGSISEGFFSGVSTITNYGAISAGTFQGVIINRSKSGGLGPLIGYITLGDYTSVSCRVENRGGIIQGGTFVNITNYEGEIQGGSFGGSMYNEGGNISGGTFDSPYYVANTNGSIISGGTFNAIYNQSSITGATSIAMLYNGYDPSLVVGAGEISAGTVTNFDNSSAGIISGGTFSPATAARNNGSITGGSFTGGSMGVTNKSGGDINSATAVFPDVTNESGGIITEAHGGGNTLTNSGIVTTATFNTLTNNSLGVVNGGTYSSLTNKSNGTVNGCTINTELINEGSGLVKGAIGTGSGQTLTNNTSATIMPVANADIQFDMLDNSGAVYGGIYGAINNNTGAGLLAGGTGVVCNGLVNSESIISDGTYNGHVNFGAVSSTGVAISGGTFNSTVEMDIPTGTQGDGSGIVGGMFNGEVTLTNGLVNTGGTAVFNGVVNNNGAEIHSGTFNASAFVVNKAYIWGGTFHCGIDNQLTVGGGNFYGPFTNSSVPYVAGIINGNPSVVIYRLGAFVANGDYVISHQLEGQDMRDGSIIRITGVQHGINGSGILGTI